jgi:hypothetical protein
MGVNRRELPVGRGAPIAIRAIGTCQCWRVRIVRTIRKDSGADFDIHKVAILSVRLMFAKDCRACDTFGFRLSTTLRNNCLACDVEPIIGMTTERR